MLTTRLLLSCIMQRYPCLDRLLASLPTQFHQASSTGSHGLSRCGCRAADGCQCSPGVNLTGRQQHHICMLLWLILRLQGPLAPNTRLRAAVRLFDGLVKGAGAHSEMGVLDTAVFCWPHAQDRQPGSVCVCVCAQQSSLLPPALLLELLWLSDAVCCRVGRCRSTRPAGDAGQVQPSVGGTQGRQDRAVGVEP